MRNLGNLHEWTKSELAQVIIQALLDMSRPPSPYSFLVERMVKKNNKTQLIDRCELALTVIAHRKSA